MSRDYLSDSTDASIVLLHTKTIDEGTDKERIQFPITLYRGVLGAPTVIESPDVMTGLTNAPFSVLITDTEQMTESEIEAFFNSAGIHA